MINKITIYVRGVFYDMPDSVKDANGYVTLDLGEDFTLSETITADALSIEGLISDNILVSSNVINTGKNRTIFDYFKFKKKDIPILVMAGSKPLPYKAIKSLSYNVKDKEIEVQFEAESPLRLLKEKSLKDLNLGYVEFENALDLFDIWDDGLDDNDLDYWLPIVDYGLFKDTTLNILENKRIHAQDLRPLIKERSLLREMFNLIGYTYSSDIHASVLGNRVGLYLADFGTDEFKLQFGARGVVLEDTVIGTAVHNAFKLSGSVSVNYPQVGLEATINAFDNSWNGQSYMTDNGRGVDFGNLSGRFRVQIKTIIKNTVPMETAQVRVRLFRNGLLLEEYATIANSDLVFNDFISQKYELVQTDALSIEVTAMGGIVALLKQGCSITLLCDEHFLAEGIKEPVSKYIRNDISPADLVKGIMQKYNLLLDVSLLNKRAQFYTSNAAKNVFGLGFNTEGYYKESCVDLRPHQIHESEIISYPAEKLNRYYELKYKRPSDPYIKNENLFSKKHDFGQSNTKDETTTNENVIFEPTDTTFDHLIGTTTFDFPLAKMTDNERNELSVQIEPRTVIMEKYVPQGATPTSELFDYVTSNPNVLQGRVGNVPTCYMLLPNRTTNLAFDNGKGDNSDLYSTFYKKDVEDLQVTETIEATFHFKTPRLAQYSLRQLAAIWRNGKTLVVKTIQKSNVDQKKNEPFTITFKTFSE